MRDVGIGHRVLGAAALWLGGVGLVFRDFAEPWQPVPADFPFRTALALVFAFLLILAGAAIQDRRTQRWGALGLAILFALPAVFWVKRVIGFPTIAGTWGGLAEQAAVVAGGVIAFAMAGGRGGTRGAAGPAQISHYVFGLCCVMFGAMHFFAPKETAAAVPAWMPFGGGVWGAITGAAHILGGLAVLSGVLALLGARSLTLMYAGFGLLVWLPRIFTEPKAHLTWGGNGINLALVGAAWIAADWFARAGPRRTGARR